ncbi:hypothetical protein GN244_ATG10968 [Phytophthora infestans]|uniref:Uncharacterized protein n=1 Tax=Phytophthora infestans TaxID=4787 RepID=A0A833T373_PHYIN|nr:hypothetical protein GN244_ATG10968 [Phytophthora infestans]
MTKTTTGTGSSREAVRHHASACASRPEQQSTLTQTPLLAEREHDSEELRTQTQCQVLVTRLTQQQPVERRTHQKMRVVSVPNNQRQAEEYEDKPMYLPMEAYDQDQTRRPAEMMEEPDTQQQQQQTHQHEDEQSDHLTKKMKSRPFTCLLDEGDAVSTAWCPHDLASADGGRTTLWLNAADDDIGPAPADTYWSSKLNGWVIDLTQTAPRSSGSTKQITRSCGDKDACTLVQTKIRTTATKIRKVTTARMTAMVQGMQSHVSPRTNCMAKKA